MNLESNLKAISMDHFNLIFFILIFWVFIRNRITVIHYALFIKLKAHCRGADWINKTIKKKRIKQGSVISLYSQIHEDDNDLIPFILETKHDPRAKRLGNYSTAKALLLILTSSIAITTTTVCL